MLHRCHHNITSISQSALNPAQTDITMMLRIAMLLLLTPVGVPSMLQLSAGGGLHAALTQAAQKCKPHHHHGSVHFCPAVQGLIAINTAGYTNVNCLPRHLASFHFKLINS